MVKAVIFDLDGVVVLSIPVYQQIFSKKLQDLFGLKVDPKDIPLDGSRMEKILKKFLGDKGIDIQDDMLKRIAGEARVEFTNMGFALNPGWKEFVMGLRSHKIKIGLGTNTSRHVVEAILKKHDLNFFDNLTTFDDVTNPKPDPEVYLKSAESMGVDPRDCVVFEDTLTGISAARMAGMKVIALTTSMDRAFLMDADRIIDSFYDIKIDDL